MHSGFGNGESRRRAARRRHLIRIFCGVIFAAGVLRASRASAEQEKSSEVHNMDAVRAATTDPSSMTISRAQGYPPWDRPSFWAPAHLQIHGGLENDIGFAKYTFNNPNNPTEEFYDFRGRFVIGPVLTY